MHESGSNPYYNSLTQNTFQLLNLTPLKLVEKSTFVSEFQKFSVSFMEKRHIPSEAFSPNEGSRKRVKDLMGLKLSFAFRDERKQINDRHSSGCSEALSFGPT
jgi:hypothetical protein